MLLTHKTNTMTYAIPTTKAALKIFCDEIESIIAKDDSFTPTTIIMVKELLSYVRFGEIKSFDDLMTCGEFIYEEQDDLYLPVRIYRAHADAGVQWMNNRLAAKQS